MKRRIINIDEDKCNGCGLCITACHEGALELVNGKARLVSDSYCDGLGACLPECPTGAIMLEEREAESFDEEAVQKHISEKATPTGEPLACGCPGTQTKVLHRNTGQAPVPVCQTGFLESQLRQWPCQLKLVPVNALYFADAHLLVAADCTAYAYANIHADFMRNKVTLIGCPKLDNIDYTEKLTAIITQNNIKSVTVLKMEVPCCTGIAVAVKNALIASQKMIPWSITTISTDGSIIDE